MKTITCQSCQGSGNYFTHWKHLKIKAACRSCKGQGNVPTAVPRRIVMRRIGFALQLTSRASNGLPAVAVGPGTRWANPYEGDPAKAVKAYQAILDSWTAAQLEEYLAPLREKNLGCTCANNKPHCHADYLLYLANKTTTNLCPNPTTSPTKPLEA